MRNFYKLASGIDVAPVVVALKFNPNLWNENTLRTTHPGTAHSQVSDIWLRFNDIEEDATNVVDDTECINYPAMYALPSAQSLIFWLMSRVKGERLGRCIITELPPGRSIDSHVDMGAPADYYDRYHIVLSCEKGCIFKAGDEQVTMATGDVWWFDNKQPHEVINNSGSDRLVMIVDIRSFR